MEAKRILILTADAGFGHRSAANALAAALEESYGDATHVDVVNPLDDERTPALLRDSQSDYDKLVRKMPEIYKVQFEVTDAAVTKAIIDKAFTILLYSVIKDTLLAYKPDIVITTYPMYPDPLNSVVSLQKLQIPIVTVVTDLTMVHRLWFNSGSDLCLVPTREAYDQALENGMDKARLRITGIPVHPNLAHERRKPATIRRELGWLPQRTTILVVGSKRVKGLLPVLHVLNHSGFPIQLALVAGGDDELYAQLKAIEWHIPTHLYNFVKNMPTLMHASDGLISKAGGLIVTEALACGLPIIFMDVTPGQEEGNVDYVIRNGAGESASEPVEVLEVLAHWLEHDQTLLHEQARQSRALGRPRSAYDAADYIWELAEPGKFSVPESRQSVIPKLMELLNQFGVSA